ncbi:MAG: Crp/Fnr family transcriptional regulator [Microscillaceae bacterium]|nr:Crp/Fnr family transcriptional regulator [Microscillaceae bacterium]
MYNQILDRLSKFISLDKDEQDIFVSKLKLKEYKKKELVLQEGDICKYAYFINSGCIRYYYNVGGEENTAQFFFENGWYTDYDSFLTGKPTQQNIETLEKTQLTLLSANDLQQLYIDIPKFERFGRLMAENAFLGIRQRSEMLENQTAEQRYLTLMKERPKVFERIPQHYIASYLGIKPPSLSRIRKRILIKSDFLTWVNVH